MTISTKNITVKTLKFIVPIIVEPDEERFYAHSPALPGLMVDGDTMVAALQNAKDGAIALLHSMLRDGDPIPLSISAPDKAETPTMVSGHKSFFQEEIKVAI